MVETSGTGAGVLAAIFMSPTVFTNLQCAIFATILEKYSVCSKIQQTMHSDWQNNVINEQALVLRSQPLPVQATGGSGGMAMQRWF